jgi:signal transduction histidine kinase
MRRDRGSRQAARQSGSGTAQAAVQAQRRRTSAKGTGLGLAIVERIAWLHGGTLEFRARRRRCGIGHRSAAGELALFGIGDRLFVLAIARRLRLILATDDSRASGAMACKGTISCVRAFTPTGLGSLAWINARLRG